MVDSPARTAEDRPTSERILDAALAAFAGRGVEATSLDSVAAEIGVRKQTILYWFPSKELLLLGVIDHAVAQLGARLSEAASAVPPAQRMVAVVDATFRLGTTHPELIAVVREVTRVGPPASTHLGAAVEPLVDSAASALADVDERDRVRQVLLAAGARVVGLAIEAEVRALPWASPEIWRGSVPGATRLIDSLAADLP